MALNFPSLQSLASGLPAEVQQALRSALAAQDKFNREVAHAVASFSAWQWVRPQLTNGWVDFSSALVARYTVLSSGLVVLAGGVKSGTIGTSVFTLPVSLRPDQDVNLAVQSNNLFGIVVVNGSGAVTPSVGAANFVALDGAFLPAQAVL